MTTTRPPLAQRATDLLAAEHTPEVPPPATEERARAIAVLAKTIATEGRARRRRRFVMTAAVAAAAALVLVASAVIVRRSSATTTDLALDQGGSLSVVAQGAAQIYQLGRTVAELLGQ